MAQIAKKTKRYPSDLADEEWDRLPPGDSVAVPCGVGGEP